METVQKIRKFEKNNLQFGFELIIQLLFQAIIIKKKYNLEIEQLYSCLKSNDIKTLLEA